MSAFYSRGHSELEMHEHRSDSLRLRNIGCLQKGIWNSHARCWNRL